MWFLVASSLICLVDPVADFSSMHLCCECRFQMRETKCNLIHVYFVFYRKTKYRCFSGRRFLQVISVKRENQIYTGYITHKAVNKLSDFAQQPQDTVRQYPAATAHNRFGSDKLPRWRTNFNGVYTATKGNLKASTQHYSSSLAPTR